MKNEFMNFDFLEFKKFRLCAARRGGVFDRLKIGGFGGF